MSKYFDWRIDSEQERIWGKHAVVGITFEIAAAWLRLRRSGFPSASSHG